LRDLIVGGEDFDQMEISIDRDTLVIPLILVVTLPLFSSFDV